MALLAHPVHAERAVSQKSATFYDLADSPRSIYFWIDLLVDNAIEITDAGGAVRVLGRRGTSHGPFRRCLRRLIHFLAYHLILARQRTRMTRAGGFRLVVHPTVF